MTYPTAAELARRYTPEELAARVLELTQTQQGEPPMTTVTVYADCHAYPWHVTDPDYPECGPGNLTRMAETYGVLVRRVTDDADLPDCFRGWLSWAWWYEITGPTDNVVRMLTVEYCDDEQLAREMVETAWEYAK